jgi:hypothetical protein
MLRAAHRPFDAAYVDRLIDVPVPGDGSSFFEDLHGHPDLDAFAARLLELARANHGWLGFYFVTELARALASDQAEVVKFFAARRDVYKRRASEIVAPGRNLSRVHGKLATVYAAGCLAIRFQLLPFTRAELLEAIHTCERDHVAFIAKELGGAGASGVNSIAAAAPRTPYQALRAYLNGPIAKSFIDLRGPGASVPPGHVHASAPGYRALYRGNQEIWLPYACFERIAGGPAESHALKTELHAKRLIASEGQGKRQYFTVKRDIPGLRRPRVIALRVR